MILSLLRIMEKSGGKVEIDGVDIHSIGLFDLRSRIALIPQDPMMFTGTVRFNIDPFERHSDDDIWSVLKLVCLADHISSLEKVLVAIFQSSAGTDYHVLFVLGTPFSSV